LDLDDHIGVCRALVDLVHGIKEVDIDAIGIRPFLREFVLGTAQINVIAVIGLKGA
jgi:hypothetical protein